MPRDNSLVGRVKKALKGQVFTAPNVAKLENLVWRSVRGVINSRGVNKKPADISKQADDVTRAILKNNVEDLNSGGVAITIK